MKIKAPYLLFFGESTKAKTATGVFYWRPELCMAQLKYEGCPIDLGIPNMTPTEAFDAGIKTLVIGVAPPGGQLPDHWKLTLLEALDAGLDIASGLHTRIMDIPEIANKAKELGRQIFDVRHPVENFDVGKGIKKTGKRLLAVGTDCAVGKMFATLAIEKEMKARGMNVDFRATGQTGIFIAGKGVSVDAVVADFISGATETLCPNNTDDHWDIIEGQGSLFHPSFAGVTLGLIHGSQPDVMVLCHEAGRNNIIGVEGFPLPELETAVFAYEYHARLTNKNAKVVGICINTSALGDAEYEAYLNAVEDKAGLPAVDPVRTGVGKIVDVL
jgi:uncharacterized NAD-dependent epimerase/dehydratase family protein